MTLNPAIADSYRTISVNDNVPPEQEQKLTSTQVDGTLVIKAGFGITITSDSNAKSLTITNTGNGSGALSHIQDTNSNYAFYPLFSRAPAPEDINPNNGQYQLDTIYIDQTTVPMTYNPSTGTLTAVNFSGTFTGNASTATKWASTMTLTLGNHLSGSVSFDGSAPVTLDASMNTNYVAAGSVSGNGLSGSTNSVGATFTVTSNATSANTTETIVFRDNNKGFSAGTIALDGALTTTRANNVTTGSSQIYLNGATGNRIDFNTNGSAAPALTTRSVGTKLNLRPVVDASGVDYAFGIEGTGVNASLWSSVYNISGSFKWYAGTTSVASLSGTGNLVISNNITATNGNISAGGTLTLSGSAAINNASGITTNQTTFNLINTNADIVNFAGGAGTINMGNSTNTAVVTINGTTISNSVSTGALVVKGGLGIAGKISATDLTVTNTITGSISGTASSVTNGVYTTDTGTVTNTMLAGNIANTKLTNSKVTIGTTEISLGSSSLTLSGLTTVTVTQDPDNPLELATKQYVDNLATGLSFKEAVEYATTATTILASGANYTYYNGLANDGVDATITSNSNVAFDIDGFTPPQTTRVLIKNAANAAHNGIYVISQVGSAIVPTAPFILIRASDYDNTPTGEITSGDFILVNAGSTLSNTAWVQQTKASPYVVGTTQLSFAQFAGSVNANALTGTTLSATVINSSLTSVGTLSSLAINGALTVTPSNPTAISLSPTGAASSVTISPTGTVTVNPTGTVGISPTGTLTLGTSLVQTTMSGNVVVNGSFTASPANLNVTMSPTGTGTVTVSPTGILTLGTAGQTTTLSGNISAITSNQTINLSPTGSGTVTINPATASNINNMNIGATTAGTGTFTKFTRSGSLSVAAWTTSGVASNSVSNTFTDTTTTAGSTIATRVAASYLQPTFASTNALTITNAANLYIEAPAAGTNTTITNAWGIYNTGNQYVGGSISVIGNSTLSGSAISFNSSTASSSINISPSGAGSTVTITPTGTVTINPSSTLTLGTAGQTTTLTGNISATTASQTINLSPSGTVSINPSNNVTISPTGTGTVTINPAGTGTMSPIGILTLGTSGIQTTMSGNVVVNGSFTASPANLNVTISPTGTGIVTINPAGTGTMSPAGILTLGTSAVQTTMSGNVVVNGNFTASPANLNVTMSPTGTGTVTVNPATAGNINNMNIGASTRGTGAFLSLGASGIATFTGAITANTTTNSQSFTTTGAGTITISSATAGSMDGLRVSLPAGTAAAGTAPLKLTSGTNLTVVEAGAIEYDGTSMYFTSNTAHGRGTIGPTLISIGLAPAVTTTAANTGYPVLPAANDTLTVVTGTTYRVRGSVAVTNGTTASSALRFDIKGTGTAVIGSMSLGVRASGGTGAVNVPSTASATYQTIITGVGGQVTVTASILTAGKQLTIDGYVRITTGGTLIPSIAYTVIPGGGLTFDANNFIAFEPIGNNTFTSIGAWA